MSSEQSNRPIRGGFSGKKPGDFTKKTLSGKTRGFTESRPGRQTGGETQEFYTSPKASLSQMWHPKSDGSERFVESQTKRYLQWLILIESYYITYIQYIKSPSKSGGLELSFHKSPESVVHKQLQGPALTQLRASINSTVAPIKEIKAPWHRYGHGWYIYIQ